MISLDDALILAGQVLADYNAAGGQGEPGQAGRLAQALRDLAAAAVAWSAAAAPGPSPAALGTGARQIADGIVRLEAEAARIDRATAGLAGQKAAASPKGSRVRAVLGQITGTRPARAPAPEPGLVVLSHAEAGTAGQAVADAIAWHTRFGDCAGCVAAGACPGQARHQRMVPEYAALRRWVLAAYEWRWP